MQNLIPIIEIWKRYLWRYEPVEFKCPNCGHLPFTSITPQEIIVVVVGDADDLLCGKCRESLPVSEGWWIVNKRVSEDGDINEGMTGVPYTQLSEIEGETYDRNMAIS